MNRALLAVVASSLLLAACASVDDDPTEATAEDLNRVAVRARRHLPEESPPTCRGATRRTAATRAPSITRRTSPRRGSPRPPLRHRAAWVRSRRDGRVGVPRRAARLARQDERAARPRPRLRVDAVAARDLVRPPEQVRAHRARAPREGRARTSYGGPLRARDPRPPITPTSRRSRAGDARLDAVLHAREPRVGVHRDASVHRPRERADEGHDAPRSVARHAAHRHVLSSKGKLSGAPPICRRLHEYAPELDACPADTRRRLPGRRHAGLASAFWCYVGGVCQPPGTRVGSGICGEGGTFMKR